MNTEKYLEYFVVRLVGNELIREDLGLNSQDSDSDARSIAARTVPHGTYLYPQEDDDEELDDILHRIMLGVRDDRRAREKAQDAEEQRRAGDEATLRDASVANEDEVTLRDAAADGLMRLFTDGGKVCLPVSVWFTNICDCIRLIRKRKMLSKRCVTQVHLTVSLHTVVIAAARRS